MIPTGFERVPTDVAKQSGYFNLPGDNMAPNNTLLSQYMDISNLYNNFPANNHTGRQGGGNGMMGGSRLSDRQQNTYNSGGNFNNEHGPDSNGINMVLPASLPFAPTSKDALTVNTFDKTLAPENSRISRRVVVTGYKQQGFFVKPVEVADFFTETLGSIKLLSPLDSNASEPLPVVAGFQASPDEQSVILEFSTPELATLSCAFDGAYFQELDDQWKMQVKRPADYVTPIPTSADIERNKTASEKDIKEEEERFNSKKNESKGEGEDDVQGDATGEEQGEVFDQNLKTVLSRVLDSKNKIYVADIPYNVTKSQIFELLQALGELSGLQVIYDKDSPEEDTRGIAFAEFKDASITDRVIEEIKQIRLGERLLRAGHVSLGLNAPLASIPMSVDPIASLTGAINTFKSEGPGSATMEGQSRVLMLLNMVTSEDLADEREYQEILQDVSQECGKFGPVEDILIPRPSALGFSSGGATHTSNSSTTASGASGGVAKPGVKTAENTGIGKVFIKFGSPSACRDAFEQLGGRKFADRTVISAFFPEENFDLRIF